jgi:hypothetical protein
VGASNVAETFYLTYQSLSFSVVSIVVTDIVPLRSRGTWHGRYQDLYHFLLTHNSF